MDEKERTQEIERRKKKIAELRAEIEELKVPYTIASLLNNRMLDVSYRKDGVHLKEPPLVNIYGWEYIRKTCLAFFKPMHPGENMTIRTLNPEEIKIAARMADDMISVWNDYIMEVYAGEKND